MPDDEILQMARATARLGHSMLAETARLHEDGVLMRQRAAASPLPRIAAWVATLMLGILLGIVGTLIVQRI